MASALESGLLNRARPSAQLLEDMRPRALAGRMAGGAFWSLVSSTATQSLGLLAGIITARYLGSAEYGQLGIVLTTANLFAIVGSAGLGVTATKHVAEFRDSDPGRAGRVIGMSSIVAGAAGLTTALLMIALAPWLSRAVLLAPGLAAEVRISAALLFCSSINGYQAGALTGFEAFRALAGANIVRGLASFPLTVIAVIYGGLAGAVAANAAVGVVSCLAHGILLHRLCRRRGVVVSYRFQAADFRLLFGFSMPVMIATLSYTPALWLSSAALARTAGYAELGVFNAAMQWQAAVLFFATALGNVGLPMLANVLPERDIRRYKRVLGINFAMSSAAALAMAIPIALASPFIMRAYGAAFARASTVLVVIVLATAVSAMNGSVGQAIWSLDAAGAGMLLALMRGLALVGASFWLVRFGALGLALAHLATVVVQTAVQGPFMICLLRKQARLWSR